VLLVGEYRSVDGEKSTKSSRKSKAAAEEEDEPGPAVCALASM
jgi:hypothetical protein